MYNVSNSDKMVNDSFIVQNLSFPIALHYVMAALIFLVAAFSIVGNVLTLLVLYSQKKYSQQIKIYRMQLAFSHVISPMATYWMYMISSLRGKWIFGQIGCSFYGFVQGFCALLSILIFAAIAFNRAHSLTAVSTPPINHTIRSSIFLWMTAFALSSPPLFGWNRYMIDGLGTTCCFDLHSDDLPSRAFVVYMLIFGFIVPLAIIVVSYRKVLIVLLNSAMFKKRSTALQYTDENSNTHSFIQATENKSTLSARESSNPGLSLKLEIVWRDRRNFQTHIRPMKTMLLITVCFLCAWLPYAVLAIVEQFTSVDKMIEPYLVATAGMIAKSYVALDPIVYVLTDDAFRRKMRSYLCCVRN